MIHEVEVKELRVLPDECGRLIEMLRADEELLWGGEVTLQPVLLAVEYLAKAESRRMRCSTP